MTTMIALVGEQPLPNFLPVRHYYRTKKMEDIHVLLVYTEKTSKTHHHAYLRDKLQMDVRVHNVKTDAYDIPTIVKDINDKLDELEASGKLSLPLEFNLTGGTKPMSLAAYEVAAQRNAPILYLQSENGKSVADYYDWQGGQLVYQSSEPLTTYIELRDMLELHLGAESRGNWSVTKAGHVFEQAIAQSLIEDGYEALCGVKGVKKNLDIDVMAGLRNQISIIEAKYSETGGPITKLEGIKQLSWAMRYLKGTYIKQILVFAGEPSGDGLLAMSEALEIPIIPLLHYREKMHGSSLPYEDKQTLLTEIKKIMQKD